jgi:hypothetical protein
LRATERQMPPSSHLAARPVLLERQQLESGTAGSSLTAY